MFINFSLAYKINPKVSFPNFARNIKQINLLLFPLTVMELTNFKCFV